MPTMQERGTTKSSQIATKFDPRQISRRPASARPSVTSSAYSRSPPTGQAAREARHAHAGLREPVGEVRRGRLAGHVRVRREHDLLDPAPLDAPQQLVDAQVAPARRRRAARARRRARGRGRGTRASARARSTSTGCSTTQTTRAVAARVDADRAELLLGQVAALAAEADALLHVLDRARRARAPRPCGSRGGGTRAAAPCACRCRAAASAARRGCRRTG